MVGGRQRGFSLIELLAALAVLALGVLGMAGLQLAAMQQARSSLLHGEAGLLAQDMAERIRANPAADYGGLGFAGAPAAAVNCATSPCSNADLRAYDLAHWRCAISARAAGGGALAPCAALGIARGALPGAACPNADAEALCASGQVTRAGDTYEIAVKWAEPLGAKTVTLRMRRP